MKIVLDTEVCKKEGKDVDVALYLISLLCGSKITIDTFEKARQQRLLMFEQMYDVRHPFPEYVSINVTGEHIVESLMASSENVASEERCKQLAETLREIFPAGKKPGYAYTWRDSVSCITDRLKKFFMKYGEYSDEQVIEATKAYVASFNGNYQYMQLLKYFIWKNKVTGEEVVRGRVVGEVERQSQLAAWIEDTPDKKTSADWEIELR